MSSASTAVKVSVEGHELSLSNLGKVMYPEVGFTKRDVIRYYASIGPVLLPHVMGRPLTLKRYPDGVDGKFFFEKNAPRSTPAWVHTAHVPSQRTRSGSDFVDHPVICDLASLTWAANLASIELHVPLWRATRGALPRPPDLMVFDLDPGPGTSIVECCEVATLLAPRLKEEDYEVFSKTSGSKGLQLYVPIKGKSWDAMTDYAHDLAKTVEAEAQQKVVTKMSKALRDGKVLIDWSQNNPSKTTIAAYSLRARQRPTVSTPVQWSEVIECLDAGDPELLVFEADEVTERVQELGDLFAPLLPTARTSAKAQR